MTPVFITSSAPPASQGESLQFEFQLKTLVVQMGLAGLLLANTVQAQTADAEVNDQGDSVEAIEEVVVFGQQETQSEIQTRKLLNVAGAGNDPMKAIGSMPGVTFATSDGGSVPAVRGSSPYENLYIVDFMPVGYVFHSDSSSIMSDNTLKDFKLETSGFGPEYDNASAAVIDVTSRDPYNTDQLILDVSLLRAGIFAETGDDDSGGFFSARESLFQYYLEKVMQEDDMELTLVPEYYDYQGKYQWRFDKDSISIQAIGARDKAGIKFDDDSDEVKQDPELSGGIEYYQQFHSQGLIWDHWYANGATHIIGLYSMQQDFRFSVGRNNDIDINFVDSGLRSRFSVPVSDNHTLNTGIHYVWRDVINEGQLTVPPCDEFEPDCRFSDGDEVLQLDEVAKIENWDIHLEDEWQISDSVRLDTGVLASWDDYTEQRFLQPKIRGNWQINDDWRLASSYGKYHKMSEQFYYYSHTMGNPDLKQPESTHYEIEVEHQLSDGLSAQVDLYYKDMSNLITSRLDSTNYPELSDEQYLNLPKFTNDAEGEAWGVEVFVNKDLTSNWYGWLSMAYSRTFRKHNLTGDSFRYEYDQPLIVNMVASWQGEVWEYGIKGRVQSGQLFTPVTGATYNPDTEAYDPSYGRLNSERLPTQYTLDLRAERELTRFAVPVDIYFEAINVLGASNVQGYEYSGDYSTREEVKGLPTLISFGAKVHFY